MFRRTMFTMVMASLAACGAEAPQTITGRVALGSFPERVTQVAAIGDDGTFVAPVAADGRFDLAIPAGDRYRIEMRSSSRESLLVFPRTATTLDTSWFVDDAGPAFDLGEVRYVRDARGPTTTIADAAIPDHSPEDGDGGGRGGEGEGDGGGGGQDTGTGGGQDTGTGGGQDTGTGGGGG